MKILFALLPLFLTAESVFVESNNQIVVWNDMTIPAGKTYESVVVMNGELEFLGKTKSMVVVNGEVNLGRTAEVLERLVLVNGKIQQQDGAKVPNVSGPELSSLSFSEKWKERWQNLKEKISTAFSDFSSGGLLKIVALPIYGAVFLAAIALMVLIGIIVFYLAPSLSIRADTLLQDSPMLSVFWGLIGYISVTPILLLLLISIVGILIIPFFILFVLLVGFAGLFAGLRGLGLAILKRFGQTNIAAGTFLGLILGFAILMAPFVGQILFSLIWLAGTGALLRSFVVHRGIYRVSV